MEYMFSINNFIYHGVVFNFLRSILISLKLQKSVAINNRNIDGSRGVTSDNYFPMISPISHDGTEIKPQMEFVFVAVATRMYVWLAISTLSPNGKNVGGILQTNY